MEEKVKELLSQEVEKYQVWVDSVALEKEGRQLFLRVVLDADNMIDLEKVVEVTKAIDPILDKENIIEEEYVLDVYAKSKGEV